MFVSAAVLAAIASGCRSAGRPAPDSAPADPRRCALAFAPDETPQTHAARCAEWFIVRNGYTTRRPVADTTQIAWEAGENVGSATERLASRRGLLREEAFVVCRGRREGHGPAFGVGFVLRPDPPSPSGRAVTMDTAFAEIHFERGSFDLTMALADSASCRVIPGRSRR